MIDYIRQYTNSGDLWEDLINRCYRMRYQKEGYHEIPASYKGDGGIEGFTDTGVVYQCYCPEKQYSDNEYYEHIRTKLHNDIGKFIDPDYEDTLKRLGIHDVHEWHLVIPEYRDKRILEYRTTQIKRVIEYKTKHPDQCNYIADDFRIDIKVADDFVTEISSLSRTKAGLELDLRIVEKANTIDLTSCPSEKVSNIKRKIKAVMGNVEEDDDGYKRIVQMFLEAYITGISLMEKLRQENIDVYEDIMSLKLSYKRKVEMKTLMQQDHSLNRSVFDEIFEDFTNQLNSKFTFLNQETRDELAMDIIGEWLADCPMEFKI